jgi:hypothetical protein
MGENFTVVDFCNQRKNHNYLAVVERAADFEPFDPVNLNTPWLVYWSLPGYGVYLSGGISGQHQISR